MSIARTSYKIHEYQHSHIHPSRRHQAQTQDQIITPSPSSLVQPSAPHSSRQNSSQHPQIIVVLVVLKIWQTAKQFFILPDLGCDLMEKHIPDVWRDLGQESGLGGLVIGCLIVQRCDQMVSDHIGALNLFIFASE